MLSGYIGERIRMTDDKLLGGGGQVSVCESLRCTNVTELQLAFKVGHTDFLKKTFASFGVLIIVVGNTV